MQHSLPITVTYASVVCCDQSAGVLMDGLKPRVTVVANVNSRTYVYRSEAQQCPEDHTLEYDTVCLMAPGWVSWCEPRILR